MGIRFPALLIGGPRAGCFPSWFSKVISVPSNLLGEISPDEDFWSTYRVVLRLECAHLLGLVCGQTTMSHIALFARMHWPVLKEPLGFLRDHPPHATTISRTLAGVPYEQLQGAMTGWVSCVVAGQELDASVDDDSIDPHQSPPTAWLAFLATYSFNA